MKRRNLIIGSVTGVISGIAGGIIVFWGLCRVFFGGFSLQDILSNPYLSSALQVLVIFSAFLGLLGGLISGLVGGKKTALLLGSILGFCFGCVGGILAFLGFIFA